MAFDLETAASELVSEHESLIGRITALKSVDIALLQPVIDEATDCWRDGDDLTLVHRWLFKPLNIFGGLMPLEAAALGRGEEVVNQILAAKHGVYQ